MRTPSDDAPPGSLGELLARLRRSAPRLQADVAEHLGVAQSYVSEVEAGKRSRIPFDRLARWVSFLAGTDADRLAAFRLVESGEDTVAAAS